MSEFDPMQEDEKESVSRRAFLAASAGVFGALALWFLKRPSFVSAAAGEDSVVPATVTIVQFGADGKATGKLAVPHIVRTDAEWKQQLSPIAYEVARHEGTERPYSGDSLEVHDKGLFRCVCCDTALFSSETKFDSGTGWPSFWQPIAKENVREKTDSTLGMMRTEVACRQCDGHLGHVFDDGPRPTGLRYCMNSASMKFVKLA